MNSITLYCLAHLTDSFIVQSYSTHLDAGIFNLLGPAWAPLLSGRPSF